MYSFFIGRKIEVFVFEQTWVNYKCAGGQLPSYIMQSGRPFFAIICERYTSNTYLCCLNCTFTCLDLNEGSLDEFLYMYVL